MKPTKIIDRASGTDEVGALRMPVVTYKKFIPLRFLFSGIAQGVKLYEAPLIGGKAVSRLSLTILALVSNWQTGVPAPLAMS